MVINGIFVLTNTALYVKITVSMKVDNYNHQKAKDHRLQSVVFHLGYLSFSFPSNHLLMKFANTPAATERIKIITIFPSFLSKGYKTLDALYHKKEIIQVSGLLRCARNDGELRIKN